MGMGIVRVPRSAGNGLDGGTPQELFDELGQAGVSDDEDAPDNEEELEGDGNLDDQEETDGDVGDDGSEEDDNNEEGESPAEPPKKYAGMYDSVEQLENAYKNLQTQYQQTKDLAKQNLQSLLSGETPVQQQRPRVVDVNSIDPQLIQKAMAENPGETIKMLMNAATQNAMAQYQAQTGKQNAKTELESFVAEHKDFDEHATRIYEILKENPEIISSPRKLDIAYKMAKAEAVDKVAQKAHETGVKQGYKNAQQKAKVNAQQGGKQGQNKTVKPSKSAEESILDDIMDVAGSRSKIFG